MITLAKFKSLVAQARADCLKEIRQNCGGKGKAYSRGTFLATANDLGQCRPSPEAECHTWRGTLRELDELVERVKREYPEVKKVYVAGGYDYAESLADKIAGVYDPWVGAWAVDYWTREGT